jgi:Fungal N-terminal domain of STAND proteins
MDPFSIATGVAGLLSVCYQIGPVLFNLYCAIEIVDTKINRLQVSVESFIQLLTLMQDTLKREEIRTSFTATGHISNHWNHLSTTIKDGHDTLSQLRELLEGVNRSTSVLSGPRKHARLQRAAEEISVYQQQIQGYKDTLQLSLQAVTV